VGPVVNRRRAARAMRRGAIVTDRRRAAVTF
jgi:hypothetical protein